MYVCFYMYPYWQTYIYTYVHQTHYTVFSAVFGGRKHEFPIVFSFLLFRGHKKGDKMCIYVILLPIIMRWPGSKRSSKRTTLLLCTSCNMANVILVRSSNFENLRRYPFWDIILFMANSQSCELLYFSAKQYGWNSFKINPVCINVSRKLSGQYRIARASHILPATKQGDRSCDMWLTVLYLFHIPTYYTKQCDFFA